MLLVAPDCDGVCLRFSQLPSGRPSRGSDIADGVPALDHDEPSTPIVPETDVGRSPRLRRSRRQLEGAMETGAAPQAKEELLHAEVPDIRCLLEGISLELDHEGSTNGQPDSLPCVEGVPAASAGLDVTPGRATDARERGRGALRQLSAKARLPHLSTQLGNLLQVCASRFRGQLAWLELRHVGCMVAASAYLGLMPNG